MTPLSPSRELDALIAEKVMGWKQFPYTLLGEDDTGIVQTWGATVVTIHHCPPGREHVSRIARVRDYSTDMAAAMEVVDALIRQNATVELTCGGTLEDGLTRVRCEVWGVNAIGMETMAAAESADSAPLAICLAALKAVESAA